MALNKAPGVGAPKLKTTPKATFILSDKIGHFGAKMASRMSHCRANPPFTKRSVSYRILELKYLAEFKEVLLIRSIRLQWWHKITALSMSATVDDAERVPFYA